MLNDLYDLIKNGAQKILGDKKNIDNNKDKLIYNNSNPNNNEKPKLVVNSLEELERMNDEAQDEKKYEGNHNLKEFLTEDYGTESEHKHKIRINYKLPTLDAVSNERLKEFKDFVINENDICLTLGTSDGVLQIEDINNLSNILIGGTVSSGKTNLINCFISSILLSKRPDDVKLVLIDFKRIELNDYNGIPHLLMPVITDPKKASVVADKIINEIERRYEIFDSKNVKNIVTYNELIKKENKGKNEEEIMDKMPYIIIIIDSYIPFNDEAIRRIADMGNKAGVFLILATNSCSKEIISYETKINFPTRICFKVPSKRDSINAIDMEGANKLTEIGDYLLVSRKNNIPKLIKSILIDDMDITSLIDYSVKQQIAQYDDKWMNLNAVQKQENSGGEAIISDDDGDDDLYNDVVEFAITTGKASASLLQRRFKIGYNRAARLVDFLEERGIVGPQNGSKPREVLVKLNDESNNREIRNSYARTRR